MAKANVLVMGRTVILWIGSVLILGFNIFVGSQQSLSLIYFALALSGAFALSGIAFGIWAAKKVRAPLSRGPAC